MRFTNHASRYRLPIVVGMLKLAVQQGRSDTNERGVRLRYIELVREARTTLAEIFSILFKF